MKLPKFLRLLGGVFSTGGDSLFDTHTDDGRGRAVMIASAGITAGVNVFTAGIFYTGFLLAYGINIVNVGIITFIPSISSLGCLFSASIFSRFRRRKVPLLCARLGYYIMTILGITVLPEFIHDPAARLSAFVVVLFFGHLLNAISAPCYTAWFSHFIPEPVRARFFSVNQFVCNAVSLLLALGCSTLADSLAGTDAERAVIIGVRYIGFVLALAEALLMLLPREIEQPRQPMHNPFTNLFGCLREQKFRLTMIVCFVNALITGLTSASLNYYLLDTAKVSYTYIALVNICYLGFILLLNRFWQRKLSRYSWFTVFWVCTVIIGCTYFPYSFVNATNYLWLMTLVRFIQHFVGVGHNVTVSNLPYINLPDEGRTEALSCYTIISNAATLSGQALGTLYIALTQDHPLHLLGMEYGSVQQLLAITGISFIALAVFSRIRIRALSPESDQYKLSRGKAAAPVKN